MLIDFLMQGIALQPHDVLPASSVFGYCSMRTLLRTQLLLLVLT